MNYQNLAEKAIAGEGLSEEECYAALRAPDCDLLALLDAAYRVRRHYWGNTVQIHVLTNVKSGLCPEDCHYCSQSSVSEAPIDKYTLIDSDKMLEEAKRAKAARAVRYCIVASGRGPTDREIDTLCESVVRIKAETDLDICCSLGLLEPGQARRLKAAGVNRINHNLNTSRRHHPNICTTHTYDDRMRTLRICKEEGLELCSGAIFGQGETDQDIVDLCRAFGEIGMDSIPINFLITIDGTPFGDLDTALTPTRCLKILCLARLLNPDREVRVAGGREFHLKSLQPLALYPANSIFVKGYLTTPGQDAPDAWRMIEDLGFTILEPDQATQERKPPSPAAAM